MLTVTLLLPGALLFGCASGAPKGAASTRPKPTPVPTWTGTASGELTVGAAKVRLRNAYAVVVRPRRAAEDQTRILLTEDPVPLEVLDDLLKKLPAQAPRGVVVVLDARNAPLTVFFHHEEIPAGLEVREVTKYAPSEAPMGRLAGRLTFKDPGFSFGFDAQFDAPIYRPPRRPRKSDDPSLTPRDRARAEIDDEGLEFTPEGFRKAVLDDDVETVQLFLDAGMSATTGEPKWSILYDAVEQGRCTDREGPSRGRRRSEREGHRRWAARDDGRGRQGACRPEGAPRRGREPERQGGHEPDRAHRCGRRQERRRTSTSSLPPGRT